MSGTPGPWFIEGDYVMDRCRSRIIVVFGDSDQDRSDAALVAAAPTLLDLVRDLTDPDDCHYDHHGYCQAHNLSDDCPHKRAKTLLAELGESA